MSVRGSEGKVSMGETISELQYRSSIPKINEKAGRDGSKELQSQ